MKIVNFINVINSIMMNIIPVTMIIKGLYADDKFISSLGLILYYIIMTTKEILKAIKEKK